MFGGDLGQSYLGTQGDVWDAHKDMALAALGCADCNGRDVDRQRVTAAGFRGGVGRELAREGKGSTRRRAGSQRCSQSARRIRPRPFLACRWISTTVPARFNLAERRRPHPREQRDARIDSARGLGQVGDEDLRRHRLDWWRATIMVSPSDEITGGLLERPSGEVDTEVLPRARRAGFSFRSTRQSRRTPLLPVSSLLSPTTTDPSADTRGGLAFDTGPLHPPEKPRARS